MIFANSQAHSVHDQLEERRRDAAKERLLRERPRRASITRHALAAILRNVADAVEPRAVHRHHPHLPS